MWNKGIVQWEWGGTLYLSVPFTWMIKDAEDIAASFKGPVVAGGPAVALAGFKGKIADTTPFDVLSMHNPLATFTTRGCVRGCKFCAVPRIEGEFRELAEWKHAPIVCDNNFLAASRKHKARVIDSLSGFSGVDFNQGLDARLFTPEDADMIARLKAPVIRFSFDNHNMAGHVKRAIDLCAAKGFKKIGVYVLIGFNDTPPDALARLELVREWGALPNPMRYQPLDCQEKNSHVADGWTAHELKRMQRYYSRLVYLGHIPYGEYVYTGDDTPLLDFGDNNGG